MAEPGGLLRADSQLIDHLTQLLQDDTTTRQLIPSENANEIPFHQLNSLYRWSFFVPDLSSHPEDLHDFISKDLIQTSHLRALATCDPPVLNWNPNLARLLPLFTPGDGNCLLHAVGLALIGITDKQLHLRKALHHTFTGPASELFAKRWLFVKTQNEAAYADFQRADKEDPLRTEWEYFKKNSGLEKVRNLYTEKFAYLEQIHIFALAHVLRRPIIVYADPNYRNIVTGEIFSQMADPDRMDGVYLPLLIPPAECFRQPIALAFHDQHFSAVVAEGSPGSAAWYPLVDCVSALLPIHFLTPNESARNPEELLGSYMDLEQVSGCLCARQILDSLTLSNQLWLNYLELAKVRAEVEAQRLQHQTVVCGPCLGGCGFSGSTQTDGYCSVCYRRLFAVAEQVPGKCQTPGCDFAGSMGGYCSVCSKRNQSAPPVNVDAAFDLIKNLRCANCSFYRQANSIYCTTCDKSVIPIPAVENSQPVIVAPPSQSVPDNGAPQQCKGGCGFFGSSQWQGYCSSCFKALPAVQPVQTTPQVPQLCKGDCGFFGSPQWQGYCSSCYQKYQAISLLSIFNPHNFSSF